MFESSRPDIEVLVQNNAFSSYVNIIIVDKEQKQNTSSSVRING